MKPRLVTSLEDAYTHFPLEGGEWILLVAWPSAMSVGPDHTQTIMCTPDSPSLDFYL